METNQFKDIFDYIDSKELITRLEDLKSQKKTYSDVVTKDEKTGEELQYVNLVQQGGGTLGISLVGFCFVMEYLGIRFLRLAGTSAGAINTLFMAALGKDKREAVTPELFKIINNLNMFDFVDGHWMAKLIIKSIISKDNWFKSIIVAYVIILSLLILYFPFITRYSDAAYAFYGIFFFVFLLFTGLFIFLYLRFKKAKFGINPGKVFHNFLKNELLKVHVTNKKDLDLKANFTIHSDGSTSNNFDYKFKIRTDFDNEVKEENENIKREVYQFRKQSHVDNKTFFEIEEIVPKEKEKFEEIKADYTFITVDIALKSKVEFPKKADLYWENIDEINPADFVRASMSIPIFFEPFFKKIKKTTEMIKRWDKLFIKVEDIPDKGIFIDGGSISNFPMNIFHNPEVFVPRLPIVGLRINSDKKEPIKEINTFIDYAGQIIGTMKSSYDKDFLLQNLFYEKYSIADINTFETKANWLDFNMNDADKKALFEKGVESALNYLENFNWKNYKEQRAKIYKNE